MRIFVRVLHLLLLCVAISGLVPLILGPDDLHLSLGMLSFGATLAATTHFVLDDDAREASLAFAVLCLMLLCYAGMLICVQSITRDLAASFPFYAGIVILGALSVVFGCTFLNLVDSWRRLILSAARVGE